MRTSKWKELDLLKNRIDDCVRCAPKEQSRKKWLFYRQQEFIYDGKSKIMFELRKLLEGWIQKSLS